ncbi:MAG: FKBP-type peptidyl-prolyl cis-trans isomerase [Gemmatimonadota bacterium]|nr:MAG: FKBP-type peptidyl-prolyl cis-trans isomerase [Gemmatimonadota bacterium]
MTNKLRYIGPAVIFTLIFTAASLVDPPAETSSVPDTDSARLSQGLGPPPVEGDTITTASGLKYIVILNGTGPQAERGQQVRVHYSGWLEDGSLFDSSVLRGEAFEFRLGAGQVIRGWDEGIGMMQVGGKWRFIIPPELAYGERGYPDVIPPSATLVFDVALLGVR